MENKNSKHHKCTDYNHNHSGGQIAFVLILVGVVFLLFNLNIIPIIYKPIIISWQMLLIVIGIFSLFKRSFIGGSALIIIGMVAIMHAIGKVFPQWECLHINMHTYWPIGLILLGAFLLFMKKGFASKKTEKQFDSNKNFDNRFKHSHEGISGWQYIHKNIMFGGSKQIVFSQEFKGGKGNVIFGGLEIDLRKAKLAPEGAFLELNAAFGGIILHVPSDWKVDLDANNLLGGFEDKRENIMDYDMHPENTPYLKIKANCVFGGGELKN